MARDDLHLRVRLPKEEKEWLAASAKKNLRTQSAELVVIIRDKMKEEAQNANS